MASCDELMIGLSSRVAKRMTETGLSGAGLREKKHLDPFMKDAFAAESGTRPVSKKFDSDAFVGLGGQRRGRSASKGLHRTEVVLRATRQGL
jgi:hypothetical protein